MSTPSKMIQAELELKEKEKALQEAKKAFENAQKALEEATKAFTLAKTKVEELRKIPIQQQELIQPNEITKAEEELKKAEAAYKEMRTIYQPLSTQPPSEARTKAQRDFIEADERVVEAKAKLQALRKEKITHPQRLNNVTSKKSEETKERAEESFKKETYFAAAQQILQDTEVMLRPVKAFIQSKQGKIPGLKRIDLIVDEDGLPALDFYFEDRKNAEVLFKLFGEIGGEPSYTYRPNTKK